MSSINYRVVQVDLATIRSAPGENILPVGVAYTGVIVQALPVGAVCSIAFGENKDLIPLSQLGQSFDFTDECGHPFPVDEKLLFQNPVGAGIVVLLVSIAGTSGGGSGSSIQGGN
jgi:hypothetical protein